MEMGEEEEEGVRANNDCLIERMEVLMTGDKVILGNSTAEEGEERSSTCFDGRAGALFV